MKKPEVQLTKDSFDLFDKVDLSYIGDFAKREWRDKAMPKDFNSEQWISKCYAEAVLMVAHNKGVITLCEKKSK